MEGSVSFSKYVQIQVLYNKAVTAAVTKLRASRSRKDFTPVTARLKVTSTALLALLRCEF
jgi:hypothetical protein